MRGPGTSEDQIKALQEKLGDDGVSRATSIVNNNDQDIVTLSYRLMRANIHKNRLPKSVNKLLENLPAKEASNIRDQLVAANTKQDS